MKFRKKPVVIEAQQFLASQPLPFFLHGAVCFDNGRWYVETLEGPLTVSEGDWIIRGVKGEFYPCKPDIFAATYEPAIGPQETRIKKLAEDIDFAIDITEPVEVRVRRFRQLIETACDIWPEPSELAEPDVAQLTAIVREADEVFQRVGGSSRHWVTDCFVPLLEQAGLKLVRAADSSGGGRTQTTNDDDPSRLQAPATPRESHPRDRTADGDK